MEGLGLPVYWALVERCRQHLTCWLLVQALVHPWGLLEDTAWLEVMQGSLRRSTHIGRMWWSGTAVILQNMSSKS